jgi:hypothetical protein
MKYAGHVAHFGEVTNTHKIFAGKPQEARTLGKCKRGWKDSIRIDMREIEELLKVVMWTGFKLFKIGCYAGIL